MTNKPALLAAKDLAPNGTRIRSSARTVPFKPSDLMQKILPEDLFLGILCLERKRSERSRKKFLLLLIDAEEALHNTQGKSELLAAVIRAADASRRETDPAGWYKERATLGIIFTELGAADDAGAVHSLQRKAHANLATELNAEDLQRVRISIHMFGGDSGGDGIAVDSIFYPDLIDLKDSKKVPFVLKRVIDVVGSLAAIVLLSPLFLLIAIAVKATSKGPILFKQERLGQFGKAFTCLKFRSMKPDSSPKIHQEFIAQVIRGTSPGIAVEGGTRVYKMTRDPRVTFIGRLIRRTSLDELPQFFNVLKGEMSLVGPRPPIAYEVREYDIWHRRRILEVKPGITGLWQVSGRSHLCFDDMVRLDLRYARGWSLWLDLRILLATPRAVAFGDDAY
jgi:lipopolysaccharide/colanic/teichoic acid biosynthesis glycosyltransferase